MSDIFSHMKSVEAQSKNQVINLKLNVKELNEKIMEISNVILLDFEFNNISNKYI